MSRITDLEQIISTLDTLYDDGEDCICPLTGVLVSDSEYDALRRELKTLAPKSEIFKTATASKRKSTNKKIKHHPPMTSIEKASHEDFDTKKGMLLKWIKDCLPNIKDFADLDKHEGYFYQSYKLDGVALGLYYEKGNLVKAGLRPRNGVDGEDVTEQVKYVTGIPQKLKLPVTCSVRGELICKLTDFEKVQAELTKSGEKLRANPRNHAAGGIRQFKDPVKVRKMLLNFIAYSIEGLNTPPFKSELDRAKWSNTSLGVPFVQIRNFDFDSLKKMEEFVSKLDYEVDGVIVGVNNLDEQEQLGRHGDPVTGNPKGKIAWKFAEEEAQPVIKEIQWQTGRTGKIVPVAIFDGVRLAGTTVTRATLHNAGFILRNKIIVGSKIRVLKAGKIIPKVVGIVSGQGKPNLPKKCPNCNSNATLVQGGSAEMYELVCDNEDCGQKKVGIFNHYLTTFGVLGLGGSRVASLIEGGKVGSFADYYKLNLNDVMACGLTKRQALLALASIHLIPSPEQLDDDDLEDTLKLAMKKKKVVPLAKLLASFGMESAGRSAGKALSSHFLSFEKIRKAKVEELEAIEDIGSKTATIIHDYLVANKAEIDDLLNYIEPELPKTGKLSGKTFCLSGSFADGKRELEEQIENLGGKCVSSVGKKVTYLVAGPGSGSKSDKAKELDIKILDEKELKRML